MTLDRRTLLCALSAAFAIPRLAFAEGGAPRLFSDSKLIERERISIEVTGTGPDLVFVPGLSCSRRVWSRTAERLKDRYRLHLVQVAGFAGEPARANASGPVVEPTALDIDGYIQDAGLAPATVIGHSLGGTMALYLAQHRPQHLRKILLIDAVPSLAVVMNLPPQALTQMRAALDAGQIRPQSPQQAEAQIRGMVTSPEDQEWVLAESHASDGAVVAHAYIEDLLLDMRAGMAEVATPITLLYPDNVSAGAPPGAVDPTYKAAFADAQNATLVRIDSSRHFIMLDQPAAFARELDRFLAG